MPVILYTSKNIASRLIAEKLMDLLPAIEPIETNAETVLDVPVDYETDCIIILSSHKSRSEKPMLTAHYPGNWDKAEMGGEERRLNIAHGRLLKRIITGLETGNRKHGLNWPLYIEADHHGPLAKVPLIYVEIGSTEREWRDETAAKVVAEAVDTAVRTQDSEPETGNREPETVFGVGGGHYAREFTRLVLDDEGIVVGHICPKYAIEYLEEDTFRQAIEKSIDPVKKVLVLKDGTNAKQKEKVLELCERFSLQYEEI